MVRIVASTCGINRTIRTAEFRMRKSKATLEPDDNFGRPQSEWDDPDVTPDIRTDIPTGRHVDDWEDTHEHDRAAAKRKRKPRVKGGSAGRFSMRKRA